MIFKGVGTQMRILRSGAALALALGVSVANAAGLGKLTVNSALGQILNAEIDLVSLQPGELESLTAPPSMMTGSCDAS